MKFTSVILSLFFVVSLSAQDQSAAKLESALAKYRKQYLPEKIYVHTDKSIYAAGEIIWFAAYMVDGQTHWPITASKVVHVELINEQDEIVAEQKLFVDLASAPGDFALPGDLPPGDYHIRAYTNFQRNYASDFIFQKDIKIVPGILAEEEKNTKTATPLATSNNSGAAKQRLKVQFFPEGGDCVIGLPCKYAMLVQSPEGTRIEAQGRILDDQGNIVSYFRTIGRGTAIVPLGADPDRRYYAVFDYQGNEYEYVLPKALEKGYQLTVESKKDAFVITTRTNIPSGMKNARLMLHLRGLSIANIVFPTEEVAQVKLDPNSLPAGVMTATLFTPDGEPVAERLFFVKPNEGSSKIEVAADQVSYQQRTDGKLLIRLNSETDSLPTAVTSVSVFKDEFSRLEDGNIYSWLLLNSDIQGRIERPGQFFQEEESRKGYPLLDALLMTQGWRRFRWENLFEDKKLNPEYSVEAGLYIDGELYNLNAKKKPQYGKVFLTIMGTTAIQTEMAVQEDGQFSFGPYQSSDTIDVVLQARRPRRAVTSYEDISLEDSPLVGIRMHKIARPPFQDLAPRINWEESFAQAYQQSSEAELTVARNFDSLIIDLDVVEVGATRITNEERYVERTGFYNAPSDRLIIDSIPGAQNVRSIVDLLRRFPGVDVRGRLNEEQIFIRGVSSINFIGPPIFVLDGMIVDLEAIRSYPVLNVEFIDVLKGPRAAAFGSRGANGAILVYSKNGGEPDIGPTYGVKTFRLPGFYKARQFFIPADNAKDKNRPDIRTTLHWEPSVYTDDKGLAQVNFKTAAQNGQYRVIVEGISSDGMPLYSTTIFEVK